MRKVVKALGLSIAVLAMVMLVVGCGGGKQATSSAASSSSTTSTSSAAPAAPGKPTVTFMVTSFLGTDLKNEHSDEVIRRYEEHTGIHVDWLWESNDVYKEKLGLTLMDRNNMPMIITGSGEMTANVIDAAKRGAFWDLTPFLEDKAAFPNLSQYNRNVAKAFTVDGQLVGVYRSRWVGRLGLTYRTDWAEAVGITKAPETIEEVYDMMYKFTYNDPDGNGKKDTYGLELTKYVGPLDIIQTWFGTGNEWVEKDGKLVPVHQTPEFMEALRWMRKMYADGLVRPDWPSVDSGTFADALKKGQAGIFIDVMDSGRRIWDYYLQNDIRSVVDPAKGATITFVGPIEEKTLATSGHNGYYLITKAGAKTEQDVRNALTFLDKMNDPEMLVLADYGLEGITYEFNENGDIVLFNKHAQGKAPQVGLNQSVAYIPYQESPSPHLAKTERAILTDESYARNAKVAVFNPALGYLANSTVNAEVGTDIEQIIDDARTQYVCGLIDDAGFAQAAKAWADRGGSRLIDDLNKMYQADLAKK